MTPRPVVVLEALSLRDRPTGVAGSLLELVTALAAAEPFAALAGLPHWRVIACPGTGSDLRRAWFLQRGLPELCRRHGAAVLHCLQPVSPARAPCPVAVTVHDLAWREMPEVVPRARRWYYGRLMPIGLRRAARILASSEATARNVARCFPDLSGRLRVTPLGTPSWVHTTIAGPPEAAPHRPYFLFVGTLEPRKNLPRLLDAYERLLAQRSDDAPDLRLVGSAGWAMGPLRERLARPSLRGRVRVCGYRDRSELRRLYESALALTFPSLCEGFGLPVLEAMAFGLPVLTSDQGALREVAGQHALLVDPLDVDAIAGGLGRLVDDETLRRRLREAGPPHAARWSWNTTADMTAAVYAELAAGGTPRK